MSSGCSRASRRAWLAVGAVLACALPARAVAGVHAPGSDSTAAAAVAERFHAALAAGDSATVAGLLAPEAVVLEGGRLETREQYLGGHLRGDMAFAAAVRPRRGPTHVRVAGDVAWAWSTGEAEGTYREREVRSATAELMVLVRRGGQWLVTAVHWSNRALR
jgi:uncharacterized protein (TIGR02246 family)